MVVKKKVKKEAVVKVKPSGEEVVKEETAVAEIGEVKAEEVDVAVGDIEDIGQPPRKRVSRSKS